MEEKALQREEVRATMQPIQRSLCHQLLVLASVHVIHWPAFRHLVEQMREEIQRHAADQVAVQLAIQRLAEALVAAQRTEIQRLPEQMLIRRLLDTQVAVLSDTQAAVQRTPIQRLGRIQLCALRAIQRLRSIHLFA
ncbi:hypothetical protein OIU78_004782 [Salix suchowensis]|nr:hypothetical protein OIU78_004782 [Salix suchowensis]